MFEITRAIYCNSERSEQFLVTEHFLACSWCLEFKLEKKYWEMKHAGKVKAKTTAFLQ